MEKKSPFNTGFEKYIRQALGKTGDEPDDNIWANIAARQKSNNLRLRLRYYGARAAIFAGVLALTVAGWKYFSPETSSGIQKPGIPQQNLPAQKPQAANTLPPASGESTSPGKMAGESIAGNCRNKVPATTVRFRAEEGLRYENPATGTSVYIPAHALTRAGGHLVSGEVEFQLREYRSAADFMASGIPMHYSDERGDFFFNSGGMFDVRVSQHGEALHLASGQACDVRFTSTHALTQPSLYYFDESDQRWKYQPDPAFSNEARPVIVTERTVVNDNRGLQVDCLPMETDPSQRALPSDEEAATWMQEAVQTGYDYAFGKKAMPGWFKKHPDWTNDQLLGGLERSTIRLKRHKDADDMFFPEDMNNVFTELKAFKDCYFIIDNGLGGKKSFTKEEFDSYWERVSVVQMMGARCYVSFFGKQGLLQFYATLIGSTENPGFDADKVLAEYTRLRNERQQNFEKQANAWRHFLYMAQPFQTPEEWCLDAYSWFGYFEANLPAMRKRYAALTEQGIAGDKELAADTWKSWRKRLRDIVFDNYKNKASNDRAMPKEGLAYALRVTNFGTYNCDQIFNIFGSGQETIYVLAAFKTSDGRRIVPQSVSVMERNTRLFFTLPKTERVIYAPGRKLDIIVTDAAGRFYRLPRAEYARLDLKNQLSHTFTMEDVTEKTQTPREWASLLEI